MGFTSDSVFVVEEDGEVEVCVTIFSPDIESPVSYPFEISVSTTAGNAGILYLILAKIALMVRLSFRASI